MGTASGQTIKLEEYSRPDYWIRTVDLTVQLDPTETQVSCRMQITRNTDTTPGTPLVLDGDELKLLGLTIDGKTLSDNGYNATSQELTISELPDKEHFELTIETALSPNSNTKLMGLFRSNGVYCTQCEAEGFRRITYFLDRPDVLAVYTTRIEADKSEVPLLLGNGNQIGSGELEGGRHFAIWHDPHPKPSYLFALVGGNLDAVTDQFITMNGREVELNVYVEKGKASSATYAMDALKRSMKWDEERFGREYDLDIFNIVAVSDFNMGAMENKGLNIFNDKYVLADAGSATDADFANVEGIIAHEYFHNWTGNRITCRDWFQLCLKEGLTVYRDQEFSSDERSRPVMRINSVRMLKLSQFPEDAGPLAHPVRPEAYKEINNFYTATVYQKGAELVRMIATILGETDFRKGMDLYFERHDGDAATVEDFLKSFEDASGTDLTQFSRWYSQAGTPHVSVSTKYDSRQKSLHMEFEQSVPATPGQSNKSPVTIPIRFGLVGTDGKDMEWESHSGGEVHADVITLSQRTTKVDFFGLRERPIPSLLRGFSAPVNLEYRLSEDDLVFLAGHDSDPFNRWQALQSFATRLMCGALNSGKSEAEWIDQRYLDAVTALATDASLEPAYRSLAAVPPCETDIAREQNSNIDPDAIFTVRSSLIGALAKRLIQNPPTDISLSPGNKLYSPDAKSAGERSLALLMLGCKILVDGASKKNTATDYYTASNNLTERIGALAAALLYLPNDEATRALSERFYLEHKSNPLIVDKWFTLQATVPGLETLDRVIELTRNSEFSMGNPNRVRALLGAFATSNPTGFNRKDGKGYEFMADKILELDSRNPQVAARILTAFRSWRSMESTRRGFAQKALERIAGHDKLSRDVGDIVERTLA